MIANIKKTQRAMRALAVAATIGLPAVLFGTGVQCADAALIYSATQQNLLVSVDSSAPGAELSSVAITGMASGERVQGMDFRLSDNTLFALSSNNRLFTIDTVTGVASLVGRASTVIQGNHFGFEFDQAANHIRVVGDTRRNVRINPFNANVTNDSQLNYANGDPQFGSNPSITNIARANNGTYFGIDTGSGQLVTLNPVNAGVLNTIGSLGLNVHKMGGFDIDTDGLAYAAMRPNGSNTSNLYLINLNTGLATLIGQIGSGHQVRAMAVAIPSPGSIALLMCGLVVMARPRSRRTRLV